MMTNFTVKISMNHLINQLKLLNNNTLCFKTFSLSQTFFSRSYLYQIAHLGDDDDEPEFSSAMPLEEGDTFFFAPRELRNLVLVDELESLSPILGCHIADLGKKNRHFFGFSP